MRPRNIAHLVAGDVGDRAFIWFSSAKKLGDLEQTEAAKRYEGTMATLDSVTMAAAIFAAAAMVGCGGTTLAPAAPAAPAAPIETLPTATGEMFAVWHGAGKTARTNFYDSTGALTKSVDGIFLLSGDQQMRIDYQEKDVPSEACPGEEDTDESSNIASMTLVDTLDEAASRTLVDYSNSSRVGWLQQSIKLHTSLGPTLVLTDAEYTFSCHLHADTEVTAWVLDVASDAPIKIPALNPDLDADVRAKGVAFALSDGSTENEEPESSIEMFRPRVRDDGTVATMALVVVETSFGTSSGDWDSFTTSNWVEIPDGNVTWPEVPTLPAEVIADISSGDDEVPSGLSWGSSSGASN